MKTAPTPAAGLLAVLTFAWGAASAPAAAQTAPAAGGGGSNTKIAVIDIDRVAQMSESGKTLFAKLKEENDRLGAEKTKREQEIRDLQAKMTSEILSADARERLGKEIEKRGTELKRWLEDAQAEFQEKQQKGEEEFQKRLEPVVKVVAQENGIGLILRATPGLTFVLDQTLDITPKVIEKLNTMAPPPKAEPAKPKEEAAKPKEQP